MPNLPHHLTLEFLSWLAARPRTYAETIDAWRSNCPRHTVWEDAQADGLIQFEGGDSLREYTVVLSPRGQAVLDAGRQAHAMPAEDRR